MKLFYLLNIRNREHRKYHRMHSLKSHRFIPHSHVQRMEKNGCRNLVVILFRTMTQSVRIIFEYQCQRCGFSWSSTVFVRTDEFVVFTVCRACRTLVRPHNRVIYRFNRQKTEIVSSILCTISFYIFFADPMIGTTCQPILMEE